MATGRAKPAFETVVDGIPMNGPTVLFNGAAIYDFPQKKYLVTAFLPDSVRQHVTEVVTALPQVAVELYHDDNTIHALNANDVTLRHMHITHAPSIEVDTMDDVPSPSVRPFSPPRRRTCPPCWTFWPPGPGTTTMR